MLNENVIFNENGQNKKFRKQIDLNRFVFFLTLYRLSEPYTCYMGGGGLKL